MDGWIDEYLTVVLRMTGTYSCRSVRPVLLVLLFPRRIAVVMRGLTVEGRRKGI